MVNVTEELKISFDLLLINLNLSNHMWLPHWTD